MVALSDSSRDDSHAGRLPAASRLRVELAPVKGMRRWRSLGARIILSGVLGDVIDDWPPLSVAIFDVETGACVYREKRPMGSGDAAGIKEGIRRDLESLTLDEFCKRYDSSLP